jgi:hypothetical protein
MRKIGRILAAVGSAAVLSAAAVQGVAAASTSRDHGHDHDHDDHATVLRFDRMSPVTGPYVGAANPIRGVPGGGLPWVIRSARGSLDRDGHLVVKVRGLVLASTAAVPVALRGTNPLKDFDAIVSCQSIGAGNMAAVANVTTGNFAASPTGNSVIHARVTLPRPCIAPIVFVAGPGIWLAATGS